MKATFLHYPDTPIIELQITRYAFTGIISVTLTGKFMTVHTTECAVPTGHTNKATLGVKLPYRPDK